MKKSIKPRGLRRPAKASLWYIGAGSLTKAVGVLTTPIFTRLLSESEYGQFSLYISWLGLASIICSSVSQGSVIYKGIEKYKNKNESFIFSALMVSFGFCGIICLLLLSFSRFLGLDFALSALISVQLICDTAVSVNIAKRRYNYQYLSVTAISVIQAICAPFLGIALVSGGGLGYVGRIYGVLLASVFIAIPLIIITARSGVATLNKEMSLFLIKSAAPVLPVAVSSSISSQADKLLITAFMGKSALARYSVAHSLGSGLIMTIGALGSALNPWIVRKIKSGQVSVVSRLLERGVMILSASVLFLIGGSPEVMMVLAPKSYLDALPAVTPIAISTIPSFINSVCTVAIISKESGGRASIATVFTSAICAIASLILIPLLGFSGAATAILISQTILAAINLNSLLKIGLNGIFPIKKCFRALLFAILWSPLLIISYESLILRLALLSVPLGVLVYNSIFLKEMILEK